MSKLFRALGAAGVLLFAASAAASPVRASSEVPQPIETATVRGTVDKSERDGRAMSITIKDDGQTRVFVVGESVPIRDATGKALSLDAVRRGARVELTIRRGTDQVQQVIVRGWDIM